MPTARETLKVPEGRRRWCQQQRPHKGMRVSNRATMARRQRTGTAVLDNGGNASVPWSRCITGGRAARVCRCCCESDVWCNDCGEGDGSHESNVETPTASTDPLAPTSTSPPAPACPWPVASEGAVRTAAASEARSSERDSCRGSSGDRVAPARGPFPSPAALPGVDMPEGVTPWLASSKCA